MSGQKNIFRSCDGNSGFSRDLILMEVSELNGIVWFIVRSVCSVCRQFWSFWWEFNNQICCSLIHWFFSKDSDRWVQWIGDSCLWFLTSVNHGEIICDYLSIVYWRSGQGTSGRCSVRVSILLVLSAPPVWQTVTKIIFLWIAAFMLCVPRNARWRNAIYSTKSSSAAPVSCGRHCLAHGL